VQHELDAGACLIKVHAQVPGLLHDPLAAGMGGGAQDPDPAGGVLDRGQHVGFRSVEQVDGEQVQGLRARELRPVRAGAPGRGSMPCRLGISQTVEGAMAMPSPASSPAISLYPQCSLSAAMRSTSWPPPPVTDLVSRPSSYPCGQAGNDAP
jgi:hypothetical protein